MLEKIKHKNPPKKKISSALAMNLVIGFLALLMVGYMLTAGILLGKKTVQLEDKLDKMEENKIIETTDPEDAKPLPPAPDLKSGAGDLPLTGEESAQICFDTNCFNIEIADTQEARSKGLMFREFMGEDEAMLFIFETEQKYGFWMKNTVIPLDMIWLNSDLEVVYIAHDVQPCGEEGSIENNCPSYRTETPALYVLEINAGLAKNLNINIADTGNFTTP